MASLGHIAVGLAAARWESKQPAPLLHSLFASMTLCSGMALLPDADVLGFRLGIAYGDEWGHRGASHSLVFALLIAATVSAVARLGGRPLLRTFVLMAVIVGSHGLLDMLTDGGLGAALLWPFSNARLFAPVTPLPVAPIGRALLSQRGLHVMLVETVWFAPLFIYAAWPQRALR